MLQAGISFVYAVFGHYRFLVYWLLFDRLRGLGLVFDFTGLVDRFLLSVLRLGFVGLLVLGWRFASGYKLWPYWF